MHVRTYTRVRKCVRVHQGTCSGAHANECRQKRDMQFCTRASLHPSPCSHTYPCARSVLISASLMSAGGAVEVLALPAVEGGLTRTLRARWKEESADTAPSDSPTDRRVTSWPASSPSSAMAETAGRSEEEEEEEEIEPTPVVPVLVVPLIRNREVCIYFVWSESGVQKERGYV